MIKYDCTVLTPLINKKVGKHIKGLDDSRSAITSLIGLILLFIIGFTISILRCKSFTDAPIVQDSHQVLLINSLNITAKQHEMNICAIMADLPLPESIDASSVLRNSSSTSRYNSIVSTQQDFILKNPFDLPLQILERTKIATLAVTASFSTFVFTIPPTFVIPSEANLQEYIISLRLQDASDNISFSFVHMTAIGSLIPQYIEIPYDNTESCGLLGLRTCHHRGVNYQLRGFTSPEIALIEHALLRSSRETMKNQLICHQKLYLPFLPPVLTTSTRTSGIDLIIASMKENLPKVRQSLLDKRTKVVPTETILRFRRRYSQLKDSGLIDIYENVTSTDLNTFLHGIINFPLIENNILGFIGMGVMDLEWHFFHISYSITTSTNKGLIKDLFLMTRAIDSSLKYYDWLVFDSIMDFGIKTDVMVVRSCEKTFISGKDCSNELVYLPPSITMEDIMELQTTAWVFVAERYE